MDEKNFFSFFYLKYERLNLQLYKPANILWQALPQEYRPFVLEIFHLHPGYICYSNLPTDKIYQRMFCEHVAYVMIRRVQNNERGRRLFSANWSAYKVKCNFGTPEKIFEQLEIVKAAWEKYLIVKYWKDKFNDVNVTASFRLDDTTTNQISGGQQ